MSLLSGPFLELLPLVSWVYQQLQAGHVVGATTAATVLPPTTTARLTHHHRTQNYATWLRRLGVVKLFDLLI